jgi:hypothetical protein
MRFPAKGFSMLFFRLWLCALVSAFLLPVVSPAQTGAALLPTPRFQALDANGYPLAGGFVYTYAAGTSTPLASYTSSSGTVANPNPVVLDSSGSASIWLSPSLAYKVVVQDASHVQLYSTDGVLVGGGVTSANGAALINYTAAGTGGVTRTVAAKLADITNAADYGAVCNGSTDDTAALQRAINATTTSTSGIVMVPNSASPCIVTAGLQVVSRTGLMITSAAKTEIRFKAAATDTQYNSWPNFGQDSILRILNSSNITVSNLVLNGNIQNRTAYAGSESYNSAITVAGSSNVTIAGNVLENGMTDGVNIMSYPTALNANIWVLNNSLLNNRRNNISVVAGHQVYIEHNIINGAGTVQGTLPKAGIDVEPSINPTDLVDIQIQHNTALANAASGIISYIPSGFAIAGLHVVDNYVANHPNFGISLENTDQTANAGPDTSVVGNTLENNTQVGIRIRGQVAQLIANNVIHANGTGIVAYETAGLQVSGNVISANPSGGLAVGSSGFTVNFGSISITGNTFFDNANSTTLAGNLGYAVDAYSALTLVGSAAVGQYPV